MFTGRLETMVPRAEFFDGAVTVIRPLIYLPEKKLARYGRANNFPNVPLCPQGLVTKRTQMKQLLRHFGAGFASIQRNDVAELALEGTSS